MSSSLDKLASYLEKLDIVESEFKNVYTDEQISLLKHKGVFCYDYFTKLEETSLSAKVSFHNTLTDSNITDEDYQHAKRVWEQFNIQTLDYSDLYLKTDVLLLANVFENFRNNCLKVSFILHIIIQRQVSLGMRCLNTGIKLELLTDIDMLLFIERGIRGGVSQCNNRYSKANNPYQVGRGY